MPPPSRLIRQQRTSPRPVVVPYGIRVAAAWTWRLAVIAAGVWGLLYVVSVFQVLVVPLLVAVLLAAFLLPAVDGLNRAGVPRGVATAVTVVGSVAAVVGLVTLVWNRVVTGFGDLQEQVVAGWQEVRLWMAEGPFGLTTRQVDGYLEAAQDQLAANQEQLVSGAMEFTSTAGHAVAGVFLALFATFFFLLDGHRIWAWLVRLLPEDARQPIEVAGRHGWVTVTSYVRAVVIVALVDAVGIGIGAAVLGVPLVVPIALLVFISAFVPIVGALASGAVAVLVALVANGPVNALLMLAVVIAVQQAESQVLQPLLLGHAVRVHPLGVLVAITGGILVAGVVGALFAVPLVAVVNTVVVSLRRQHDGEEDVEPDEEGADSDAPLAPDPAP